jgi:mRNA interferase RelE/StbE
MSEPEPFAVTFTPAARRRLGKLSFSAATALYEHLVGPVAANPHRLGKPLEVPFEDVLSTRRGEYRALYTVDDRTRVVTVLAVAHRRDAYRPRLDASRRPGQD